MTPERWQQVKAIFDVASQLTPDARGEWLARTSGGDLELRREVESLLAAHDSNSARSLRVSRPVETATRDPLEIERRMRDTLAMALGERYEIIRPLGVGGMGAVYLARDLTLDLRVAIKVLRPELASSEESRQRFLREARIAARLRHPNIVRLHQYLQVGDLWCFIMDHVPGGGLDNRLWIEGEFSCSEARDILMQLAGALDYAHAHGVIHRDIKPANILFDTDRSPMLADFGIAKAGDSEALTPTSGTPGTPAYMSPEQLQGRADVDGRSDIYSLGLVAYAMLTGKEPYAGMSLREVLSRKMSEDPVPITRVAPRVTPELAKVVMQCLARDRAQRYPDGRALKESLQRADCTAEALTEELVEMPGFGQWSLVWAAFWSTYALVGNHGPLERILTFVVAALVPLGFALQVWNLGRHSLGGLDLARVSYWPPVWWGMWWPSGLRRPTDLWSRLPWPARAARVALSIFFVAMPALIMAQSMRAATSDALTIAEYALLIGTALAMVASLMWSWQRGVPPRERTRLLVGATLQSKAWRSPALARLLAPARGVHPPQRDDPRDHARAIDELVALLPRHVLAPGRESAARARRLLRVIRTLGMEIASIERDANPAEIEKLTSQLIALGSPSPGEPGSRSALRDAITNQLAVLRSMRRDAELVEHEREEVVDLIRSTWAHLRRLHEDVMAEAADVSGAVEALGVLGVEIERRLQLWAEEPDATGEGGVVAPATVAPHASVPRELAQVQGSSPLGP